MKRRSPLRNSFAVAAWEKSRSRSRKKNYAIRNLVNAKYIKISNASTIIGNI
jgi:hypothetical protein